MDDHRLSKRVKQTATNVPVDYESKPEQLSTVLAAALPIRRRPCCNSAMVVAEYALRFGNMTGPSAS